MLQALACALPFRTVFAKQLGISATGVGVIFLAIPFMKIVTNPLFGFLADYFKKFRLTISLLMAVVAVSHIAMVYIPPLGSTIKEYGDIDKNISVVVEYNYTIMDPIDEIISLQVLASIKVKKMEYQNFSCEIECDASQLSYSSVVDIGYLNSTPTCRNNISLHSRIHFETRACYLDFYIENDTLVVMQNTKSPEMQELYLREVSSLTKQNCSATNNSISKSSKYFLNDDIGYEAEFNKTQISVSEIISRNHAESYYIIKGEKIFLINKKHSARNTYPCETRLYCLTKQCRHKNKSDIGLSPTNEFVSFQFWALFLLLAVSSSTFCAVLFLIDAVCYEMLQSKKSKYGNQRLWGTIGWGLGAFAGGFLNQIVSDGASVIDYTLSFYLLAVLIVIDLIPVSQLNIEDLKYSSHICKDVCFILTKPGIITNFIIVFVVGVLSGLIWNYQFWFMEEIGFSQILLGLSQILECIFAEVPCFLISGWVIKKIGYVNCNSLTLLCFGLRYLSFVYMYDPWMMIPSSILHGPTFGIFYASVTMYGKTEAPPGTEATVQSLLAMIYEGVGVGIGSILGGIGIDKLGSRATFFYAAMISFLFLALNVVMQVFYNRKSKKDHLKGIQQSESKF